MKSKLIPLFLLPALFLSSCNKKVDYSSFHSKAVAASNKNHTYMDADATFRGYINEEFYNLEIDFEYNQNNKLFVLESGQENKSDKVKLVLSYAINLTASDVSDSSDYQYYTSPTGFKTFSNIDYEETIIFNSYGLTTKVRALKKENKKETDYTIKIKYSRD